MLNKIKKKIKEKGFLYIIILVKKKFIKFDIFFIYPIAFFLCLVIFLIRPILHIRFGSLISEKIGPFSSQPELILCEKENKIQPTNTFDIFNFCESNFVCNEQLLKMWKRKVRVWKHSIYFYVLMKKIPFGKNHIISPVCGSRDTLGLLEKSKKNLKFSQSEIIQAEQDRNKMGISNNDKYVLIINRGQRFLDEEYPFDIDFNYHSFRNVSINDFMPTAEALTKKNYFVIRMGQKVSDLMKTNNPKIIEYDEKGYRTELLDIFLSANCKYIIGSDTGFYAVAGWNFRKPMVVVNFSQLEWIEPWLSNWIFIFRKYWSISDKKFLTIEEILKSGAGRIVRTEDLKKKGLELAFNTPEEIKDAVEEMELKLEGKWSNTKEDEELQSKFWSHFESSDLHGNFKGRIGTKFLRQNRDLI